MKSRVRGSIFVICSVAASAPSPPLLVYATTAVATASPTEEHIPPLHNQQHALPPDLALDPFYITFLSEHLRANDNRLVRPTITEGTILRQMAGGCDNLPVISEGLRDGADALMNDSDNLSKALDASVSCTVDNPRNREVMGRTEGFLPALVDLIRKRLKKGGGTGEDDLVGTDDIKVAAKAAELIWSLSFNNAVNHGDLVESGAVEALSKLVLRCDPRCNGWCYHAKMWGMAALQNLMASYCATKSGHCLWRWNWTGPIGTLQLREGRGPLVIDGSKARAQVLQNDLLMAEFRAFVCSGAQSPGPHPAHAIMNRHESLSSLVTWAAAGALKNLALHAEGRSEVLPVEECLCALSGSDDELESTMGSDALRHLGRDKFCHPSASGYGPPCLDELWVDNYGETCADFIRPGYCETYGGWKSIDIKRERAWDACCLCGGGRRPVFRWK